MTLQEPSKIIIFTGYAECCRVWLVAVNMPMGRCGLCNKIPVINQDIDENYGYR